MTDQGPTQHPTNRPEFSTPPGFPPQASGTQRLFGQPHPDPAEQLTPSGRAPRDPGSRQAAATAWVVILVLLATVFVIQQLGASADTAADPLDPAAASTEFVSRVGVKIALAIDEDVPNIDESLVAPGAEKDFPSPHDLVQIAATRLALRNPDGARQSLDNAEKKLEKITTENPDANPEEAEALADRIAAFRAFLDGESDSLDLRYEGWFDTLGDHLTPEGLPAPGTPGFDAARDALGSGGLALVTLLIAAVLAVVLGALAGVAALIYTLLQISSGRLRPRFTPPEPGGSVYLETVAVFIGAFLGVQILAALIAAVSPKSAHTAGLMIQWLLVLVPFYPLLRGVPMSRLRHDIGLRAGGPAGIVREVFAGFVGYLATIPVYIAAVIVTTVLLLLWNLVMSKFGVESGPPSNPIIEAIADSSLFETLLLMTLAVLWAPFVEELVFRGSLFRHLRSRFGVLVSGLGSAAVFAMMHGYSLPLLVPVFTLGAMFSLIREYRGSIVAPMTAHFIHNGAMLGAVFVAMRLIYS